jgi:protein-L-isoaspartate O-methyltransferase
MRADAVDAAVATRPAWVGEYLRVRELEGRLYPDDVVRSLPRTPPGHPLAAEWRQRADSAGRLIAHLQAQRVTRVVDVGSGNGWLAAAIARAIPSATVVGLEANEVELAQAMRVFPDRPNVRFVAGDATSAATPLERPDGIVLASMIQYVADLSALLRRMLAWLGDGSGGEIHVLDSPLYAPSEVAAARERTRRHYDAMGVPAMADAYHHHAWAALDAGNGFDADVLYRPGGWRARVERRVLGRARSPFPWIRVRAGRAP